MTNPEQTLLQSLLPALGVLFGVALTQGAAMFQSWLDRENKREILLRTKYEELGLHFLESMKLPGALLTCATHEETLVVTHQDSANKVYLLALVYFPLLQQAAEQYIESYSALCLAAISSYTPEDKKMLGAQVFGKPEYIAASNNHREARDYLTAQIKCHAATYAKS